MGDPPAAHLAGDFGQALIHWQLVTFYRMRLKRYATFFLAALGVGLYIGTLTLLRFDGDFIVLYTADVSLRHGVNPYNLLAVRTLFASLPGGLPVSVSLSPLAYPPWYLLSTFYLGWLPPAIAARVWYLLNTAMISLSIWLLAEGWSIKKRFLTVCAAIFFLPVYGLLIVGQYTAPLLLGATLFLHAVRRESVWGAILGLLLLTFKPHFGGWIFLAGAGWLLFRQTKRHYPYRVLAGTLTGGLLLAGVSLLLIPTWPQDYWQAIRGFGAMETFVTCDICASLPVLLTKWITGRASMTGGVIAGIGLLLLITSGVVIWKCSILQDLDTLLAFAILLALLLMPYGINYDFMLLIFPLLWLMRRVHRRGDWLAPGFAYLIPWLALLLFDRQAVNISLSFSAILLLTVLLFSPQSAEAAG